MISEVVMPQMGADMEEGTIVKWLKREGDAVERGEIIAEIETDKANVEIEAFESGVFRKILAQEGDTVNVGTVIALIASAEDDLSQYEGVREAKPSAAPEAAAQAEAAAPTQERPMAPATPAAPEPRVDGRVRASPVARKLAEERGIDLTKIKGTGPDGRIVRRDVEAAIERAAAGAPTPTPTTAPAPAAGVETIALSKIRQAIARRMAQSKREAPHYYLTLDIDMTDAERLRHQLNDHFRRELNIGVHDVVIKAVAKALELHPMFNTWFVNGEVQQHTALNICNAIALDDGLIAPAILDCGNKSLLDIARASRDLAERAKSGALTPEEYTGGTFTVSYLGFYDIETLIAIIQPPQTAILGVGGVREAPVVRNGQIVPTKLMKVALSADHRVTDGVQGALFLRRIQRFLENPATLLV